ncbi:ABC transporter ATP-binding protein [Fodinicola acaciae]|uniref:ABC transporter ATP-binding protein n=1 Tax=Fodinicola acaciae TaxID=2681555 RepID=UPI0013D6FC40|nr:ATP-binding cassette domain-containing protein [Fodinicola acaciae]
MTGVAVNCEGLVHIYRAVDMGVDTEVVALAGIDLHVSAGESVALLGPSGAGKSTLLSILAGVLRHSAGRLRIGSHVVESMTAKQLQRMRASEVGVVLQGASRNLLPYLTAYDNVRFAQRAAPRGAEVDKPDDVLDLLGLGSLAKRKLVELSPGQRQRLAVAVGVAHSPGLLLADEPTSQLDHDARGEVLEALAEVNRARGTTVIVVTHDPEVSQRVRRTVTIRDGRIGAEGHRGEDFAVVARDGSLSLPLDVVEKFPPGTLVRVQLLDDGSVRLSAEEVS